MATPDARSSAAELLTAALRDGASRAARTAGGGRSLVFAAPAEEPGSPARLRAAGGFASSEEARAAAVRVAGVVTELLRSPDADPPGREGSPWILRLHHSGRDHGALVVEPGSLAAPDAREACGRIAAELALHLDHAFLVARLADVESRASENERNAEAQGDELLKLSEALFAQDVELLRQNEKLGKIEKLKSDFIEKMSRELRTPLNSIIEAIISVLAGENEALSDAAKGSLRRALDEGTSFLRTLQNILDLWRIKQGELHVEVQEVNFREVVEEAIFSVQEAVEEQQIEVVKQIEEPLPRLRTDLAKVNQILFLLLDNAVKFTPRGRVEIAVRMDGDELVCEVRDTGIGICPDDKQFIFDEFFQVDELASSRYRGAGLGLTLVRDLLTLLGGEISLASEVGRGSTFGFRIPVQRISR